MGEALAIETHGLTKRYRRGGWLRRSGRQVICAVDSLDLAIPRGTIFGFLGPNGAGKTTTIRMLLGLVRPSAGGATILGHDLRRQRRLIAPRIGAIVETPAFYPAMTGAQNLEVFMRSSSLRPDRRRIARLLERVGLAERGHDRVKSYSLGMRQRLGIAATLLTDPQIIVLDEPTNGLDPHGTVEVRALIAQLGQEGRTIFLSSHLLGEVEQVCSDVAIVQAGVTRVQGRVRDLLAGGERFSLDVAPAERALELLRAHPELDARPEGELVSLRAGRADMPAVVRALVEAGVEVFQVQPRRGTLEQLYLETTGQPAQAEGGERGAP